MIAKFFQWSFKAGIYAGLGAAAVYYYPVYSKAGFYGEAKTYAESFISQRTVKEVAEIEVQPPAIRVVTVAKSELVETVAATGTIKARDIALVGADVAGLKVVEVKFDVGDIVQKGDVLAVLDRSSLDLQLAQIDAQEAQIDANLAQAKANVADASVAVKQALDQRNRSEKLVAQKVASSVQLENAQNAYDSAVARENSTRQGIAVVNSRRAVLTAQKRQIELQIEKTNVIAPIGGVILSKNVSIGAIVSGAAGPIFQIAEDNAFEVAAEVPETTLPSIQKGMKAFVTIGDGIAIEGDVRKIEPTVNRASRLGTVNISLPQSANTRSGSFATARIETVRREAIAVPSGSLLYDGEQPYLQVVNDGVIESRLVEIGIRSRGLVEIVDGLKAEETIVATAGTFVSDGDKVRAVPSENQTAAVK